MTAKYLCCLPLRLGVLVISLLGFLASGLATAVLAAALVLDHEGKLNVNNDAKLPTRTRIVVIVVAVIYGFVALISLAGFIGAIIKKHSYVHAYSALLKAAFVLEVIAVIAYIALYFADKSEFKKLCIGDSTDQTVINDCNSSKILNVWSVILSGIIPLLFQAYGVYIVSAYSKKLRLERSGVLDQESFGFKGPGYAPVAGEESYPLTSQPTYPYADNSHSFGAKHA